MKKVAIVTLIGLLSMLAVVAPSEARDGRHHHGGVVVGPSISFGFGVPYPYPYPAYSYPDPYWYGYTPRYYAPYPYSPYAYAPPSYCPSLGAYSYSCPEWRQSP